MGRHCPGRHRRHLAFALTPENGCQALRSAASANSPGYVMNGSSGGFFGDLSGGSAPPVTAAPAAPAGSAGPVPGFFGDLKVPASSSGFRSPDPSAPAPERYYSKGVWYDAPPAGTAAAAPAAAVPAAGERQGRPTVPFRRSIKPYQHVSSRPSETSRGAQGALPVIGCVRGARGAVEVITGARYLRVRRALLVRYLGRAAPRAA